MTKAELVTEISRTAAVDDPGPGKGSSVYKALFNDVCVRFGLPSNGTMPERAEAIVTAAGLPYDAVQGDSRNTPSGGGSTVTIEGLVQILAAVQVLARR